MSLRSSPSKLVMEFIHKQQRCGNTLTKRKEKQHWAAPNQGTHSMCWCQVHQKKVPRQSVHGYPTTQPQKVMGSRQKRSPPGSSRLHHCIQSIRQITLWISCGEKKIFFSLIAVKYTSCRIHPLTQF